MALKKTSKKQVKKKSTKSTLTIDSSTTIEGPDRFLSRINRENFGTPGSPLNRSHPFYFGFLAAAGALVAITLLQALASASNIFILLIIAIYLAAGLNPIIEFFIRKGIRRAYAIVTVALGVLSLAILFIWLVIPPVLKQVENFIFNLPGIISSLTNNPQISALNDEYEVIDNLQFQVQDLVSDGQLFGALFGGVVGVGKTVLSGTFSFLTVFILTLYFMAALPQFLHVSYKLAPASRRERVTSIGNAILSRIGIFVGSQVLIAATAALILTGYGLIIGVPYMSALGMVIFFAGLIPLVGHFIGASIVTLVALTDSLTTAIAALAGYIIYQQIENYLIVPRIMKRSLAIPGIVTIVAALLGSALFGLIGAILAVPMAAALLLILEEVIFPKADKS
jgi:predicted PurR-regulated permease PerM